MFYTLIDIIFQILYFALLVRVILSWIPHTEAHPIVYYIYRITDPLLKPFQGLIPTWKIGIDLSPVFAFLALSLVKKIVFQILF